MKDLLEIFFQLFKSDKFGAGTDISVMSKAYDQNGDLYEWVQ